MIMEIQHCIKCGKEVGHYDIAMTKKMINRGATEFYCLECLCERYDMTMERMEELIKRFRDMGCTLF